MYIRRLTWFVAALLVAPTVNDAAGQVVRISVATDGTLANESSLVPSLSQDGRFVAFLSFASNLVRGTPTASPTSSCATATPTPTASSTSPAPSPPFVSARWGRHRATARASIPS